MGAYLGLFKDKSRSQPQVLFALEEGCDDYVGTVSIPSDRLRSLQDGGLVTLGPRRSISASKYLQNLNQQGIGHQQLRDAFDGMTASQSQDLPMAPDEMVLWTEVNHSDQTSGLRASQRIDWIRTKVLG